MLSFFKKKKEKNSRLVKIATAKKIFEDGYNLFLKDKKYREEVYFSMIDLFCLTNGKYLDEKHQEIIKAKPFEKKSDLQGVVGTVTESNFDEYNKVLNRDGYVVLDQKIPENLIESLRRFAFEKECTFAPDYNERKLFDPNNIESEIYKYEIKDLLNDPNVQALIMDPILINIARNYLGCEPIFDFPFMWASPAFLDAPTSRAAQLYHFDLDRIKWLKIFIYINDVDENNGPHYYVRMSHISGNKPQELLDRGYERISDEEIERNYPKDDIIQLTGKAGSVIAGDTKCWHKGGFVRDGYRLVLQFEYTASLFGAPIHDHFVQHPTPEFKKFCKENPHYTSTIRFE